MSLYEVKTVPCPNCETPADVAIYSSVNGDRRPDLTEEIIIGTLQEHTCANCGTVFKADPSINFMSTAIGLWMMARPLSEFIYWAEEEAEASAGFDDAYGAGAPTAAREIGEVLKVRLTFGWPAFREKIVLAEAGLDDLSAEMMKLAIMRNRPGNLIAPGVELRVISVRDDLFDLAWIDADTNASIEVFTAPRALYDDISGNSAWAEIKAGLDAGPYVDIARLSVIPEKRAVEPA